MLVRIICLSKSLLPCNFIWSRVQIYIWSSFTVTNKLTVWVNLVPIVNSFFFFFCTLLEKHFPQDIFFFLMRIIIFYVIIVWLIKNAIGIMITIWIFVSNPSCLTNRVRVDTSDYIVTSVTILLLPINLTIWALTRNKKNSFVKSTYHWYLGWLLRCCRFCSGFYCFRFNYLIFWRAELLLMYLFLFWNDLRLFHIGWYILAWTTYLILMLRFMIGACSLFEKDLSTILLITLLRIRGAGELLMG